MTAEQIERFVQYMDKELAALQKSRSERQDAGRHELAYHDEMEHARLKQTKHEFMKMLQDRSAKPDLSEIRQKIIAFRNERDWAQFHDPKNLAEALSIEAGELLENFLWKTTEQSRNLSPEELKNVKEELADIFIFLIYLSEEYKIDLLMEVEKKIAKNESKYPVHKSKGSNKKYTDL